MNSKLSLALLASAVVAGLALAQDPPDQDPEPRIAALEKEVEALRTEIVSLRKLSDATADLGALRTSVAALTKWANGQSQAATGMQAALDEARTKGFVAGINPDSREVLLRTWGEFASAVQTDAFAPPPAAPAAKKRAPLPARSNQ